MVRDERGATPVHHRVDDAVVLSERRGDDEGYALVCARGIGGESRQVLANVPSGREHEGMHDDFRRTSFDALCKGFGQTGRRNLHVSSLDDRVRAQSNPHQRRNFLEQSVRALSPASVIDEKISKTLAAHAPISASRLVDGQELAASVYTQAESARFTEPTYEPPNKFT